jgi:hypothetical protein
MRRTFFIFLCLILFTGCSNTIKTNPKNSTLQITTPDGTISIKMAEDLSAEQLVSLNTALANYQIVGLKVLEYKAGDATRDDYLGLVKWLSGCITVVVCSCILLVAALLYKAARED